MSGAAWRTWPIATVALLGLAGAPLGAQEEPATHAVGEDVVWEAVAEAADRSEADREMIRAVLDDPVVEGVALSHGMDLTRARNAVATLEGEELRLVAESARELDEALAGGDDTIVISTTTLIIALLVLIIILVA